MSTARVAARGTVEARNEINVRAEARNQKCWGKRKTDGRWEADDAGVKGIKHRAEGAREVVQLEENRRV